MRPIARLPRITPALALVVAACAGTNDGAGGMQAESAGGRGPAPAALRGGGADPAPVQLVGLDADQLDRLLGPADFKRSDGPAEIRQYRDAECVLDVFLYTDAASGGYRVAHVDARDRVLTGDAQQACVTSLLRARRLRSAG